MHYGDLIVWVVQRELLWSQTDINSQYFASVSHKHKVAVMFFIFFFYLWDANYAI